MILAEELFQTEIDYAAAVLLSREMLQAGVIDAEDFTRINRLHAERYQPIFLQETRQK